MTLEAIGVKVKKNHEVDVLKLRYFQLSDEQQVRSKHTMI